MLLALNTASAVSVVFFGYFCRLDKGRILYGLVKKNITLLYLQILNTKNYILSKIAGTSFS